MTESVVGWRTAFAAFSVFLGEPADALAMALAGDAGDARGTEGEELDARFITGSRPARARAVAAVVTRVVAELEGARLR
jgi:hypothetical protein